MQCCFIFYTGKYVCDLGFFFSSRRRHTRLQGDWSSDVCSSDLRGVVIVVRMIDGTLKPGMKIRLMAEGQDYETLQVGVFNPKPVEIGELGVGEVGFLVA